MKTRIRSTAAWCVAVALSACSDCGGTHDGGPALDLSTAAVTFPATQSAGALPAAQFVIATNSGTGTLPAPSLSVSYDYDPTSLTTLAWLDATSVTSGTGHAITLRPNTTALPAATHAAKVRVGCAGASGSPKTIAVSWQITPRPIPVVVSTPSSLTFTAQVGDADPASQDLTVTNGGDGSLSAVTVGSDAAWLTPSLAGSTVTVAAALGALAGGDQAGQVFITSAGAVNSPLAVPVTFHVLEPTLAVSTGPLSFAATVGVNPPEQTRAIGNSGTGTLRTVTATPSYTTGLGWMTASVTGTGDSRTLHVTITTPASAGTYDGSVEIASTGTTSSPRTIPVRLVVSTPPSAISPSPASLSFTSTAGTNPAAKTIDVSNSGGGTLATVTATPSYASGSGWMSASVSGSGNSQTVTVSITRSAAGSYSGSISIDSAGASNTPVSVPVTLTVSATGGGATTVAEAGAAIGDATDAKLRSCEKWANGWVSTKRTDWDEYVVALTSSVAEGRASYVQSQADTCVAWIDGATCAEWEDVYPGAKGAYPFPTSCGALALGVVANGNACYDSLECANGWCNVNSGNVCPGACTAFTPDGDACSSTRECGPGYVCDPWSFTPTCVAETTAAAVGQPCANSDPMCAVGLFCDGYSNTCLTQVGADVQCDWGNECQVGLSCAPSLGGGMCRTLVGQGGSCVSGTCGPGLYCSSSGSICTEQPVAGQDCTDPAATSDGFHCIDGSSCLGMSTRLCTFGTAAVGEWCEPFSDQSTLATQICQPGTGCQIDWVWSISACVQLPASPPPSLCY